MQFLQHTFIHDLADAIGFGFEAQTQYGYAHIPVVLCLESFEVKHLAFFEQPEHSVLDAIDWGRSIIRDNTALILFSISDRNCDELCDVDIQLFGWARNQFGDQPGELIDWLHIGLDQYRSMAVTCSPNQSWATLSPGL